MKKTFEMPIRVSAKQLGHVVGVSDRTIRNYVSEGLIPVPVDGLYELSSSVQAIIARAGTKPASDAEQARAALSRERAEALALSNAHKRRELVPLHAVHAMIDLTMGELRSRLNGLGASVTRDRELRSKIDNGLVLLLNHAAEGFQRMASDMEAGQ